MYLTYEEYQNMGGALDETTFNDLEYEARTYVDRVTFRRLQGEEVIPEAVKECMYHIIRLVALRLEALTPQTDGVLGTSTLSVSITSRSNDGVSESYNVLSVKDIISSMDKEIDKTINRYLQGVRNSLGKRLLYRGLYPGE